MTKKKLKVVSEIDDDLVEEDLFSEDTEDTEKIPKSERFFQQFIDYDEEYIITLYRKEKNKRILLHEFESGYTPNFSKDIQDVYGGGTFVLFAHNLLENGKRELIDTLVVHIDGPISGTSPIQDPDSSELKMLTKMAAYKELFASNNNNNNNSEIMLKMMELSQMAANTQNALITEQTKAMMQMQLDTEKRFSEMIKHLNTDNKSDFHELIKTIEVVDSIRGSNGGGESSFLNNLAPMLAPLAEKMLTEDSPVVNTPVPVTRPVQKPESIISRLPKEIVEKMTPGNIQDIITDAHNKNPKYSRQQMEIMFMQALKEKEALK